MSVMPCEPKYVTFKAENALTAYSFVKFGTTKDLVDQCAGNGRAIGVYMGEGSDAAADDFVEIAIFGGGALLKCNEAVTLGQLITSTSAGLGEVVDAASEWVGAIAFEAADTQNDVIGVYVTGFDAYEAE